MKRSLNLCVILVLMAACSGSQNANLSSLSASLDKHSRTFDRITVKWGGAVSPSSILVSKTLHDSKELDVNIRRYEDFSTLADECYGNTVLSNEDFDNIVTLVREADLLNYTPSPNCAPLMGTYGLTVIFKGEGSIINEFTTLCELSPEVSRVTDAIDTMAEKYVTDCTWESMQDEGTNESDKFCGSATSAECTADTDCKIGGCSLELCEGANESTVTTCEASPCKDPAAYELRCGCYNGKCQWMGE